MKQKNKIANYNNKISIERKVNKYLNSNNKKNKIRII